LKLPPMVPKLLVPAAALLALNKPPGVPNGPGVAGLVPNADVVPKGLLEAAKAGALPKGEAAADEGPKGEGEGPKSEGLDPNGEGLAAG